MTAPDPEVGTGGWVDPDQYRWEDVHDYVHEGDE